MVLDFGFCTERSNFLFVEKMELQKGRKEKDSISTLNISYMFLALAIVRRAMQVFELHKQFPDCKLCDSVLICRTHDVIRFELLNRIKEGLDHKIQIMNTKF